MKIAIIGNGPQALLTTDYFLELGAEVKLFYENQDITPLLEVCDVHSDKFQLLRQKFSDIGALKNAKVLRVQKRVLRPNALPKNGSSRLADLFRVVYRMNISEDFVDATNENAQIYEKLGKDVINSLKDAIESYEDFDIVINATAGYYSPLPMGAGNSFAVNEIAVSQKTPIFYGLDKLSLTDSELEKANVVTLVGDDYSNLLMLKKLTKIFKSKPNYRINIITDSINPYVDNSLGEFKSYLADFDNLININQEEFDTAVNIFSDKIMDWKNLEDYERVKVPKPAEPMSRISIFNGAVVSSVDKLLDQDGVFLTIEGSELLGTREILKTLSSDLILVGNGFREVDSFEESLFLKLNEKASVISSEPGYYRIRIFDFSDVLSSCKAVESNLMKFFSRAEEAN